MIKRNWSLMHLGIVLILSLIFAISLTPSLGYATGDDGPDDDSRKSEEFEKTISATRAKSPAIILKERIETQIPKPKLPDGKIKIIQVNVVGSTLLAEEAIARLQSNYEDKELSAKEMQRAADLVTRAYNREGYITSYGYINTEKFDLGILEIKVVEGRTGKINIEGNQHFSTDLLRKKIPLKEGDIFNFQELNLAIFRLNKHADLKAQMTCDPDVQTNLTDVTITVKDKSPMHVTFQVDNYGSEYILKNRYKVFLTHNNITGHDDTMTIKVQRTEADAHQLADIDYIIPINDKWKFEFYYMPYKIEDYYYSDNEETDFEKHARKFYFWFFQSIIDKPDCELVSGYGFVYKDIHWYTGGGDRDWQHAYKEDRFRALMWGLDFNRADKWGRWVISNDLEMGIPGIMGSSPDRGDSTSVKGAGSDYKKNIMMIARRQKLFAGIDFIARGRWQLSSQTLTGVNMFSVGGIMGVIDNRGYPRAQAPADAGRSFTGGFSFPPFGIPKTVKIPYSKTKLYDAVKLFTFFDWAEAILKSPKDTEKKSTTLNSAGCGVTVTVPDQSLSMRLDIGWPVSEEAPKDGSRPQYWWSVTKGF